MAFEKKQNGEFFTGINITPLVDVTLVLLIIFMVASPLISKLQIDVDLPKAATGKPGEHDSLFISIDENENLFLNETATTLEQLKKSLGEAIQINPGLQVVVAADKSVHHGLVVTLLDMARTLKVERFAISVSPPESGSEKK